MARTGHINEQITLKVRFLCNGAAVDPYSISDVNIYTTETGSTPIATLTPIKESTGLYYIVWSALETSTSLTSGTYYDGWTWVGSSGMPSKTQRYSFILSAAEEEAEEEEEEVPSIYISFRDRPTWVYRYGLNHIEDVGNGSGLKLVWDEARTADYTKQIHYNIYYSDSRFGVITSMPKAITAAQTATINVDPGKQYYFMIQATEWDTQFDVTQFVQIGSELFEYPDSTSLVYALPATEDEDGYGIVVESVTGFPQKGELLIDQEIIQYDSVNTTTNTFNILDGGRAFTDTFVAAHTAGSTVSFWKGIEDGNTVILFATAAWDELRVPQKEAYIGTGEYLVDEDGYRSITDNLLTTNQVASDNANADFLPFDYGGYHRANIYDTLSGECVNSYAGGDFGGYRGLNLQEQSQARLEMLLSSTGEPALLLKRKWTGMKCRCGASDVRREHPRVRCQYCYGTSFEGGYERLFNNRTVSSKFTNTGGFIMVRADPWVDDLTLQPHQGLVVPNELTVWTLPAITINDRDLIVLFVPETDPNDMSISYIYEVLTVTRNKLLFAKVARQTLKMRSLDYTDIVYTLDLENMNQISY